MSDDPNDLKTDEQKEVGNLVQNAQTDGEKETAKAYKNMQSRVDDAEQKNAVEKALNDPNHGTTV